MIEIKTLAVFFTASFLLGIAPGPDNIFVLTQSALNGRIAGLMVTAGLCTGLIVHTVAVALGIAAVFQASALAFILLKSAGALYLLYLSWQAFKAVKQNIDHGDLPRLTPGQLYRRGIIMNLTNPKISIFFLAFLPQFADPAQGALSAQLGLLGGVFILATLMVFCAVSFLAGTLGTWLGQSATAQKSLNIIAGTVFAGLALRLATVAR